MDTVSDNDNLVMNVLNISVVRNCHKSFSI